MFCPKCRAENPNIAKFCKDCGKPLPDFAQVVARTQQYRQAQAGLVGQVIDGKYRIDAKLGSGGMGNVYRATRLLMGDVVAIKTLHTHLAQDPQAAERFRREAITATKLRHKNVVTIYDVGISNVHRFPYILMELAEGYTLRQIITENKSLPLDFAVTIIAQVCAALTEAHQLGIIHRDIKPENIVAKQTDSGWHIRVLDFGIAKLFNQPDSDLTQDGSALGTPQYMSPEQCLGQPLDATSDIYSIGVTIYELLCGKPPFHSIPATAISVHQVSTPPPPPTQLNPNIHPEIEKVILKSLSKDRESRQQSANELSQEFIKAATIAFKEGAKPEKVEEPSVTPIDENVIEESLNIPKVEEPSNDNNAEVSEDKTLDIVENNESAEAQNTNDEVELGEEIDDLKVEKPEDTSEILGDLEEDFSNEINDAEEDEIIVNSENEGDTTLETEPDEKEKDEISDETEDVEDNEKDETELIEDDKIMDVSDDNDIDETSESDEIGNDETEESVENELDETLDVLEESEEKAEVKDESSESENIASEKEELTEVLENDANSDIELVETDNPEETISEETVVSENDEDESIFLELDSQDSEEDELTNETDKEDLSGVFEDAEHILDDILVDIRRNTKKLVEETVSVNETVSPPPIPKPDLSTPELENKPLETNQNLGAIPSPENPNSLPTTIEERELFGGMNSTKNNKNLFIIGGIGVLGLLLLISIVGIGIWFFQSSETSANSNSGGESSKNDPPTNMVFVSGGEFMLGNDKGDEFSQPAHKVTITPFFIDKTEVTNEEYKRFVDETDHKPPPNWKNKEYPKDKGKFPVTGVTWDDANDFAKWIGKRLPTEEEWEFAAKGTENLLYPWGNEWKDGYANANNKNKGMVAVGTTEGKSPFGLYDMAGNAWEWTSSDAKPYPNGKEFSTQSKNPKIIRGGIWKSKKEEVTTTFRGAYGARNEKDYQNTSFRCAKSIS